MKKIVSIACMFLGLTTAVLARERKHVPQGKFAPLYGIEKNQKNFPVKSFFLDVYPVTVGEFKKFLEKNPEWKKENVSGLFADHSYLTQAHYKDTSPVFFVSWFAANAFCESINGRLPTTLEWEYAAAASETMRDGSATAGHKEKILKWYSRPVIEGEVLEVGQQRPNVYGIHDLHGLIWEWTSDFNSVIMTSDNRYDGDKSKGLTCGDGGIGSKSKEDYAGFVRYSMRNSLRAKFTLTNLGFRCAYEK